MKDILKPNDLALISSMGITEEQIRYQLEIFKKGTSFVTLAKAASVGDGIVRFNEAEKGELISFYSRESGSKRVVKFVPASGAATRMFRQLSHFYLNHDEIYEPEVKKKATSGEENYAFLISFIDGIKNKKFAFCDDLNEALSRDGILMEKLISRGQYKTIIEYLLTPKGLNYANLPKAVIKFHKYDEYTRSALEEHLVEGEAYARDKDDVVHVHFTLSQEFTKMISTYCSSIIDRYQKNGLTFHIEFSEQKPSTNTVAVDSDGNLFRDEDNNLVLRPAGHGTLLENIKELDYDIIFIKNIDNIVSRHLLADTIAYKKLLGGYLLKTQAEIFAHLEVLSTGNPGKQELEEIYSHAKDTLYIDFPGDYEHWPMERQKEFLFKKLNRPLRVCGMVKNEGEPGGGLSLSKIKTGLSHYKLLRPLKSIRPSKHKRI